MNCYLVAIVDENQKTLISKVVHTEEQKDTIAERVRIVVNMHHAPFTVAVSNYIHDTMTVLDFLEYANTALNEMSLFNRGD